MGHDVVGVDAFTEYYDPDRKRRNLLGALESPRFTLVEVDLAESVPGEIVEGVEVVFHLAAQPGVRASWGEGFVSYVNRNLVATQRLLEAFRERPIRRFVNASSSSVYGTRSTSRPRERDAATGKPVRGHEARGRAPLQPVRHELRRSHRLAAVFHGLRPAPAT